MTESRRRRSQNNHLLRQIMARLREYEPDEVVLICNKFRKRKSMPPLTKEFIDNIFPPDSM